MEKYYTLGQIWRQGLLKTKDGGEYKNFEAVGRYVKRHIKWTLRVVPGGVGKTVTHEDLMAHIEKRGF